MYNQGRGSSAGSGHVTNMRACVTHYRTIAVNIRGHP